VRLNGDKLPALCADLDAALGELTARVQRQPALWELGRPGKWTAGRQVAHVGIILSRMAEAFESAESELRSGTLPVVPRRGLLHSLFVSLVLQRGGMPRGGRANPASIPADRPERGPTLAALRRDADRLRTLGGRLSVPERDRIWIWNRDFVRTWHYHLAEAVRVNAVHARLHAGTIAEIPPPD
jgi:hypothetical protein